MTLSLSRRLEQKIRDHGADAYHEEACGFLVGSVDESDDGSGDEEPEAVLARVFEVRRMQNTKDEERERRFLIAPEAFMELEKELEESAWDLVGVYHSHPDHPAHPSEFDKAHALPGLSYLILSVSEGSPGDLTSWRLSEDRRTFHSEPIRVQDESSAEEAR